MGMGNRIAGEDRRRRRHRGGRAGKFAIAAFSPPLDEAGNSVRAACAIEFISERLGVNLFGAAK